MNTKKTNIHVLTAAALMTALVFAGSYIQFYIPTGIDNTRLHLGNVMCLLGALLFGKTKGGLAAGLGSMIYDLTNPLYISTCWLTFIMKFAMAFICGIIAHPKKRAAGEKPSALYSTIGAACGALGYVVLYLLKNYIENYLVLGMELEVVIAAMVTKGTVSLINAIISVPAALLLAAALRPALKSAGLGDKIGLA